MLMLLTYRAFLYSAFSLLPSFQFCGVRGSFSSETLLGLATALAGVWGLSFLGDLNRNIFDS